MTQKADIGSKRLIGLDPEWTGMLVVLAWKSIYPKLLH